MLNQGRVDKKVSGSRVLQKQRDETQIAIRTCARPMQWSHLCGLLEKGRGPMVYVSTYASFNRRRCVAERSITYHLHSWQG